MSRSPVTVEFYGMPRARAGCREICVCADTFEEALAAVTAACPGLVGLCALDGRLQPQFLLSLDGERFITDLSSPVKPGARLLLLSADAGG